MSIIGSSLPPAIVLPSIDVSPIVPAVETSGSTQVRAYRPQWLVPSTGSGSNFDMLGLPVPKANGDLAAIIAKVSLSLESSVDDGRKMGAVAKLAGLASALNRFDNAPLKEDFDKKQSSEARTKTTRNNLDAAAAVLAGDREAAQGAANKSGVDVRIQQTRIASVKSEIADLKADLAAELLVSPNGSDKTAALQLKISGKESDKSTIEASLNRAQADIQKAQDDLKVAQASLEKVKQETPPVQSKIDEAIASCDGHQAKLDKAFADLAFAAANGMKTDRTSLEADLTAKTAERVAAGKVLDAASLVAMTMAMVFSSAYETSRSAEETKTASRDIGIDLEFQDIATELQDVSARKTVADISRSVEADRFEEGARARAENVALAILQGLTDVVGALSDLGTTGLSTDAGEARNRFRLDA